MRTKPPPPCPIDCIADASELVGLPEHCEEVLKPPPGQPALCLAFNPSGTLLATGCAGGDILIWNYQTRALVRTWKDGHKCAGCSRGVITHC